MPEISFCLFDLGKLFELLPKENKELKAKIAEYETNAQEAMAQNRVKLFSDYGYKSEFDAALT